MGEQADVAAVAARILERHPSIHLLVNNAGIPARSPWTEVDLDLVDEVSRVNYLGGVWMTRSLLSGLRLPADAGHSHIVNVVSIAGAVAFAPSGAYTAAKHAQLAFSRSLQASLRGSGIDVHTILPGYVQTEGFPQRQLLEHPVLRHIVVRPDSVAKAIVKVVEHGRTRGRRAVVPVSRRQACCTASSPASVSRLGARIVASSRAFQAKAAQSSSGRRMTETSTRSRVAVVTGASSGIGEATARLLAAQGWHCVLVARREDVLRRLAAEIGGEFEPCDVADRAAVAETTARILERHPAVHLLVNSAGILARGTFVDAPLELVERALAVNYLGGVWMTRGLLDGLREAARAGGRRARRQHRVDRRLDRVHPGCPVLGLEARPGRVLAVAAGRLARVAESRCTPSCPAS